VQIAKARGAYVVGTASAAKHEFVRSLVDSGQLRVHLQTTLPLAEAARPTSSWSPAAPPARSS
jgi:NADPH:quinone reductase-like Zn-dependent oxidoreductase